MKPVLFFSSRRRHTRSASDWSSDVCSSDLPTPGESATLQSCTSIEQNSTELSSAYGSGIGAHTNIEPPGLGTRSEERRVGKEGRSRWGLDHQKKRGKRLQQSTTRCRVRLIV